jgi:hypothetical protein
MIVKKRERLHHRYPYQKDVALAVLVRGFQARFIPKFQPIAISSQSLATGASAAPASIRAREHGVKPSSEATRVISTI